jgi:hemerythrin
METRKCSAAKKNIEAHRALVEKYTEWRKAYEAGGSKTAMVGELHEFLSNWIVGHICRVDTCLRDCRKGHARSVEEKGSVEMF